MKTISISTCCVVLVLALSLLAGAQQSPSAPKNLLAGVGPLLQSSGASNWTGN
ncbi:MAG: hypothetical protein ABSC33_04780 [Candidatus Sulfotelmatobacter sp.]